MADAQPAKRSDQAGKPPAPTPPPRFRFPTWWIVFAVALFAVNYWAGSRATQGPTRVRVPFSPFFLQQVRDGNVKQITSKGTAIQGTFEKKLRYNGSKPTTRFWTRPHRGGRTCCSVSARRSCSSSCSSG